MIFKDAMLDSLDKIKDPYFLNLMSAWSFLFPEYSDCEISSLYNYLLILKIPIYTLNVDENHIKNTINCYFGKKVVSKIVLKNIFI